MNHPLYPIFWAVDVILGILIVVLLVYVVMSWLVGFQIVNTRNQFVVLINDIVRRIAEPMLKPIRRVIPMMGGLDLAPMVLFILIYVLRMYLEQLFVALA